MTQTNVAELYRKLGTYWDVKDFSGTSMELAVFTVFACHYYMGENKTYTDNTEIDYTKINNLIVKITNKEISEEMIYEISTNMIYSKIVRGALFTLDENLRESSERNMLPLIRNCINTAIREPYGYFYQEVNNLKPNFCFNPQNKENVEVSGNHSLLIDRDFLSCHCDNIAKKLGINLNSFVLNFYFKQEIATSCVGSFSNNFTSGGHDVSFYLYKRATKREILEILAHEIKHGEQVLSGRKYMRVNSLEDFGVYDSSEVELEARQFAEEYVQQVEKFENLDEPFFFAKE